MKENRQFAGVIAGALILLFAFRFFRHQENHWFLLNIAAGFLVVGFFAPGLLRVPRKLWLKLGDAMHVVTQPLILGLIYFIVLSPTGWIRRSLGYSKLKLRSDAQGKRSRWVNIDKEFDAAQLKKQF